MIPVSTTGFHYVTTFPDEGCHESLRMSKEKCLNRCSALSCLFHKRIKLRDNFRQYNYMISH